jgi:hypothetical protein
MKGKTLGFADGIARGCVLGLNLGIFEGCEEGTINDCTVG